MSSAHLSVYAAFNILGSWRRKAAAAEQIAARVPKAAVFKTLNQTGAENMATALAYQPRPVMFVAGDDPGSKPLVLELVADLGFDAIDAGPLSVARLLEPPWGCCGSSSPRSAAWRAISPFAWSGRRHRCPERAVGAPR